MESDALRSIRNNFYLAQYQQALDEAKELLNDAQHDIASYAQIYYYRSMAQLQPADAVKQLTASSKNNSIALLAVQLYSEYLLKPTQYESIIKQYTDLLQNEITSSDITLKILASIIYVQNNEYKSALELLNTETENLEALALQIQIYLHINRIDIAEQKLQLLNSIDDDDILSILCKCYINTYKGTTESVQDALTEYTDLIERYGPNTVALNGTAICNIQLKQYSTAVQQLKQARQLSVQLNQKPLADTLINTIIAFTYMGKTDIVTRVVAELQQYYPKHSYFTEQQELNKQFEKSAANYGVKA